MEELVIFLREFQTTGLIGLIFWKAWGTIEILLVGGGLYWVLNTVIPRIAKALEE